MPCQVDRRAEECVLSFCSTQPFHIPGVLLTREDLLGFETIGNQHLICVLSFDRELLSTRFLPCSIKRVTPAVS